MAGPTTPIAPERVDAYCEARKAFYEARELSELHEKRCEVCSMRPKLSCVINEQLERIVDEKRLAFGESCSTFTAVERRAAIELYYARAYPAHEEAA